MALKEAASVFENLPEAIRDLTPRAGKPETAGRIKDYRIYLADEPFGRVPR